MEAGRLRLGVEFQPGGPRVAIARLADATWVDQPAPLAEVEQGAIAGLSAAGVAPVVPFSPAEEEGDVGVADQPDPLRVGVHAGGGLLAGEHVLPDRVARRGVEEADTGTLTVRLQLTQELERTLADVLARPRNRHRCRLGEGGDVEAAEDGEVVVADQADVAALANQLGARIGLDPVAEYVAEAPDLLDA